MTEVEVFARDLIQNPKDAATLAAFSDWLEEHGRPDPATHLREGRIQPDWPIVQAAISLTCCRFLPASFDKRFVRNVCEPLVHAQRTSITVKQWAWLWRLAYKYRRQIRNLEVRRYADLLCGKVPTPTLTQPTLFD